jgi:hypothetical protein
MHAPAQRSQAAPHPALNLGVVPLQHAMTRVWGPKTVAKCAEANQIIIRVRRGFFPACACPL